MGYRGDLLRQRAVCEGETRPIKKPLYAEF